jgi:hypothetical protein
LVLVLDNVSLIILEVADSALSKIEVSDKARFYQYLNIAYNLKPEEIADNFETFHKAIQQFYGSKHYTIEQIMVRTLHERSKQGLYAESFEIVAFNKMVNVFAADIQTKMRERRDLSDAVAYTKRLKGEVNEAQ